MFGRLSPKTRHSKLCLPCETAGPGRLGFCVSGRWEDAGDEGRGLLVGSRRSHSFRWVGFSADVQLRAGSVLSSQRSCQEDPNVSQCGTTLCGSFFTSCGNNINCGSCTTPGKICVAGNFCCNPGQIVGHLNGGSACCTPRTCAQLNSQCGLTFDSTCDGDVDCGSCTLTGHTCGPGHQCICTQQTCQQLGFSCGSHIDNCGDTINCGPCPGVPASTPPHDLLLAGLLAFVGAGFSWRTVRRRNAGGSS